MSPQLARIVEEAEARQLPVLIDEWWDAHDVRRWLARALRIDLALLTERPELVVPCLHRRCAWLGGPAEAGFYDERPEVPRDAAALRALVAPWRPGRPWLRALRPPQVPLDGGVIEEYRTSLPGDVRFSDDAQTIAVAGDAGTIAWDRLTGRRVTGARADLAAAAPAPQRWRLGQRGGLDSLVLESDAHRLELSCELGDDAWKSVHQLTDELVIASSYEVHVLVDIRRGRIVWRADGSVEDLAPSPDGERLFRASADAVELASRATGQALARWPVRGVRALSLASDGTLATRSPGVIRLWDPGAAPRAGARPVATGGWTAATFSPDGTRLLTGGLLCDGRTGAAIHALELDDPRLHLVGGPPIGCQRLVDGRLVELTPSGLRLWSSRDGSLVAHREREIGMLVEAVAFDPRGAHYAICALERVYAPAGRLRVHSLATGALLFVHDGVHLARRDHLHPAHHVPGFLLEHYPGFVLGFSPDGSHLCWETPDGERWILPLAAPARARRLSPDEPSPREPSPTAFTVTDGLLDVGPAAIPCDDEHAVASPDGRAFAYRTSHYALEEA